MHDLRSIYHRQNALQNVNGAARPHRFSRRTFLVAAVLASALAVSGEMANEAICVAAEPNSYGKNDGKTERRYQLGPLTAADFRGSPPVANTNSRPGRDFDAYLETLILWNMRYRGEKKDDQVTLELSEIEVFAAMLPGQSFNIRPKDQELMEHEQGHFDIAEIFSREQGLKLNERILRGEPLKGRGKTEAEAAEQLEKEMGRFMAQDRPALDDRQQQYDLRTSHGSALDVQRRERQEHSAQLKSLQEKRKELDEKRVAAQKAIEIPPGAPPKGKTKRSAPRK